MSKFVVVVFPGEAQAYQGTRALKDLHAEGSLTLYGMAVISKDVDGGFEIKEAADDGPLGTAVGALVGGLIGVIGGPVGVLAGAAGGTLFGSLSDLFNYGVREDFVAKVSQTMVGPGQAAIVAEVSETWTTPLDAQMEALGGTVLRTWRADFEDDQLAKEIAESRADLEQLRAEYAQADAEAKANLKTKLEQARAELEQAEQRLKTRLDDMDREASAKIAALEKQVSKTQDETNEKIRQRITALQKDYETRSGKLKKAWALTKDALAA